MSFNIVDLVKEQVQGQLIGHMGNLLGNEGGKATAAVDSMIPALLNGMTGSANTTEGANSLFGAIQDQDDSLLDNMGDLLGGGQASTVIENGNSVLSGLFGSGGLGKLAGALSGFSGVSKGGTSSLMGMLAPIVLGVLKRKVMGEGLNAGSLTSMLSSQSSNIGASLPQGLNDQLSSSGFLSGLGGIGGAGAGLAAGAAGVAAAGAAGMAGGARDIAGAATGAVGNVTSGAANLAGNARDGVAGAVGNVTDGVSGAVGNARDGVSGAVGNVTDGVSGAVGNARDGVSGAVGNVTDGVSGAVGNAKDGVAGAVGSARDGVSGAVGNAKDGVAGAVGSARDGVAGAAGSAKDGVTGAVGDGAKKGGSMFRWLLPLLALGALAWGAFTYLLPGLKGGTDGAMDKISESTSAVTDTAKDVAATATDAVTDATATAADAGTDATSGLAGMAGGLDPSAVTDEVSGLFSSATDTLGGITDADSAKAAIPAIGELGSKVDSVSGMFDKLPEAARGPISTVASEGIGKLQPLVDKALAIPGVGSILSPVIGPIMEKLQGLGG